MLSLHEMRFTKVRRDAVKRSMLGCALLAVALTSPALAQTVTVKPVSATLSVGSAKQLTAYIDGVASNAVTWSVDGVPLGNSTVGFVDATGYYSAPALPPAGWTVSVTAQSTANPASLAAAVITVRNRIPWTTTLSPNPMPLGPFTLVVNGSRFVSGAVVLWNGTPLTTTFNSSTKLTATGTAAQVGSASITVANPGPGAVSVPLTLTVGNVPTSTPSWTMTPTRTLTLTRTLTPTRTATPTPTIKISVSLQPASATLQTSTAQQFLATVTGNANQAVTWAVNGVPNGDPSVGVITASGLYTAPLTAPNAGFVTVSALSGADGITQGSAVVTIQDPMAITNARLLDQMTFGPTKALTAHLAQIGADAFIDEQLALPESSWPPVSTATRSDCVDAFFGNQLNGQDQLRQRVIYALSEIIVISMNKNTNGEDIVPWLQLLSRNAFGNYKTLLKELTLDASMGKFLDLANSGMSGGAANENYPREVMQLFSIGLYQLNLDGSQKLDAQGVAIPTYTQTDVQQLSKALTGWTYGNVNGVPPSFGKYSYYPGPMLPVAAAHNSTAKTILGQNLPANQTIQKDLDDAIAILFNHPNVGPFLATRLIRYLVTSNPSPGYISRVAAVFNNSPAGRGDMKAVIKAILTDVEARNDTPPANFGRLRTPTQSLIALSRALAIPLGAASQFAYLFEDMHEGFLNAPSVFGHYSPSYRVPKSPLFGPEFQIYTVSDAINRANFVYSMLYNPWPINPVLQPFVALAGNPTALVTAVDNALLFGRMTQSTRTALINAMPAMPDNNARVLTALYVAAASGEFLVQR